MDATEVGKYFYFKNTDLTEIQVQKLTYYAYAWNLVINHNRLFNENPQAWIHGPVFKSLYQSMKNPSFYELDECSTIGTPAIKKFLDMIYKLYGKYTGSQLENMTHIEDPWKNTRGDLKSNERSNKEISDQDILDYYGGLLEG